MTCSRDFQYSTVFSIQAIEDTIRRFSPTGMLDLLYLDAASFNSTSLHDRIFQDPLEWGVEERPNQLTKWMVEKELKIDIDDGLVVQG